LVFVHVDDIIARQSVLRTEMIDNISMDTVKSVLHSPHPQVSVSVNQKLGYRDRGTLEILCGEGLQSAIAESLEPEVPSCGRYSDPQRAIGISNETSNSHLAGICFQSLELVHFRNSSLPMNQSCVASDPKPTSSIGKKGSRYLNRESIRFAKAPYFSICRMTKWSLGTWKAQANPD